MMKKGLRYFLESLVLTLAFLFFMDKFYRLIILHSSKPTSSSSIQNPIPSKVRSLPNNIVINGNQVVDTNQINDNNVIIHQDYKANDNNNKKDYINNDNANNVNNDNANNANNNAKNNNNNVNNNNNNNVNKNNNATNNGNNNIDDNNINSRIDKTYNKNKLLQCPESTRQQYMHVPGFSNEQLNFCQNAAKTYHVIVGRSWGGLSKDMQNKWNGNNCNQLITVGKFLSCNDTWGWPFLSSWVDKQHVKTYVTNNNNPNLSKVRCGLNSKNSLFCKFVNIRIDYSKSSINGESRSFHKGFFTTYGIQTERYIDIPGSTNIDSSSNNLKWMQSDECDIIETTPTFLTSNDDIFNLGHYINDVMDVWTMIMISGRNSKQSNLLNFDGWRQDGPASGAKHRLMLSNDPDQHGPFSKFYESWFANLTKAKDYGKKRVCYSEIFVPYSPGMSWYWYGWGNVPTVDCAAQAPSPIFQSFNYFLRNRWKEYFGMNSLIPPLASNIITIVLERRLHNPKKSGTHASCRVIENINEVIQALKSFNNVKVIVQNFAEISVEQQIAIAHSASVFVSMHGAGTVWITNMAIGSPNCCALVELQPDPSFEFTAAHGNFARFLGLHFFKYQARREDTSVGTKIDINKLKVIVASAIDAVRTKPTCLLDTRDVSEITSYL